MASQGDIQGLKEMQRMLAGLDKKLVSALQREAKAIAKPGADQVKSAIPSVAPLSGMNNRGRLGWGIGMPANKVTVRYSARRSRVASTTSLVAIRVDSPVAAMIDVAGKGKGASTRKKSKSGDSMIVSLKSKNVNNFAWPSIEREIPRMNAEIRLVLNKYAAIVNREVSR